MTTYYYTKEKVGKYMILKKKEKDISNDKYKRIRNVTVTGILLAISGIIFLMYGFSFLLIWGITLLVAPFLLEDGIVETTLHNRGTVLTILYGGGIMSLGLYFNLTVIGEVGLLLSTTISGGVGIVLGLITSIGEEGIPDKRFALPLIIITALVLLAAGFFCNKAAEMRDKELSCSEKKKGVVTGKVIFLMLLTAVLTNGWSVGTAAGTARGFAPVLTCAYMASGSFLSVGILLGIKFTVKGEWKKILCIGTSKQPIWLSAIAAFCHYGGNLISIYSMPAISATLSFLFGRTANVWTIFWGIFYREFSGISRRTKYLLWVGILLYFVGIAFLGIYQLG